MKTLIIGANGFTGRRILQHLSLCGGYELTGCSLHKDIQPESNTRFVQADINDHPAIGRLIGEMRPDVVINASALSVPDYCESHHEEAHAANVLAVENMARCCEQEGSRFIHLSTDFVFDGKNRSLYIEEDIPAPVNYYGLSKYQGELAVAANCSNYANVRVVVVYGKALPGQHGNILQLVKNRLEAGQQIRVSKRYLAYLWRRMPFDSRYRLPCCRLFQAGPFIDYPGHHRRNERSDSASPFQRTEHRKSKT